MRDLTPEECEFIAGGLVKRSTSSPGFQASDEDYTIVVVASPPPFFPPPYYPPPPPPYIPPPPPYGGGGGGGGTPPPPPTDESHIDVTVNFTRPLTAQEQKAVNDFKAAIATDTAAINSISDTAKITLADGRTVTGAELKTIWAKTDFTINETGTSYANGTQRGEADYNGGDPRVSINIDTLAGYDAVANGVTYVPLHELGHMTEAGRYATAHIDADGNGVISSAENDANERVANDIAQAVLNAGGVPVMAGPGGGYTNPTTPLVFQ